MGYARHVSGQAELVQALKHCLWCVGVNTAALALGLCYMACLTAWNVDLILAIVLN